ncbi:hypothetical protein M3649_04280 [Ureibacillus chungkukjangi]|uniref:hypothetical protein n=1 Tax=Ureibacillus chungkukjangi TaxID=1202712 RepID=UPI00203D8F33|nr:hypothetical protein [Ureibacillus chungkukjangi]MCM3387351.1 hypothetical protein [Ureibacillus chungkukjangi]
MLVKVQLHDGKELESTIENFILQEFVDKVNQANNKMILFGNYGIVAGTIKLVETVNGTTEIAN